MEFLFDTNIYTEIIKDSDGEKLVENIIGDKNFVIHNFRLIREELKNTPKNVKFEEERLRFLLLELHDKIVKGEIILETKEIIQLAEDYYNEYKKQGGGVGKDHIIKDFKIVACAALKNMDIIVSNDESSLKCDNAKLSYFIVNTKINLRTPSFYNYLVLKKLKI